MYYIPIRYLEWMDSRIRFTNFKYKEGWSEHIKQLEPGDVVVYAESTTTDVGKKNLQFHCGYVVNRDRKHHRIWHIKVVQPIKNIKTIKKDRTKIVNIVNNFKNKDSSSTFSTHCSTLCSIQYKHINSFIIYLENVVYASEMCNFDGIIRGNCRLAYDRWFKSDEVGKQVVKYMFFGFLDHNEKILDGFFDPGRCNFRKDYSSELKKYHKKVRFHASNRREVIVVNKDEDRQLRHHYRYIKKMSHSIKSKYALTRLISGYVANVMTRKTSRKLVKKHIKLNMKINKSNVVPIGQIKNGVCRHKAILFKYLCDQVGIDCILIRGKIYRSRPENEPKKEKLKEHLLSCLPCSSFKKKKKTSGNHVWNLVVINRRIFVVDVRNRAGKMIKISDAQNDKLIRKFRRTKGGDGQLGATLIG